MRSSYLLIGREASAGRNHLSNSRNYCTHPCTHAHTHRRHPPLCCSEQELIASLLAFVLATAPLAKGEFVHRSLCLPGQTAHSPFLMEYRATTHFCSLPPTCALLRANFDLQVNSTGFVLETSCSDPSQGAGPTTALLDGTCRLRRGCGVGAKPTSRTIVAFAP